MNDVELIARERMLAQFVVSAGEKAQQCFEQRQPGEYTLKGHQDFLTEADGAVEQHLRDLLEQHFPEDAILGEETGGIAVDGPLWVIDPIDGTANFARGIPHFCVCIAFCVNGHTELGAIYQPLTQECYVVRRGQGVTKNGHPLAVSQVPSMSQALIEMGWSARVPRERYLQAITQILAQGASVRRGGSGALALAWVAEGRTDGYAEIHMNAWDCLAGLLMVREAGGKIGTYPEQVADIQAGGAIIAVAPHIATDLSHAVDIPLA